MRPQPLPWHDPLAEFAELDPPAVAHRPWRHLAAAALRAASRALDRHAVHLVAPQPAAETLHDVEFHAEAGAPEGALFVNGRLVGHLPGVTRL